MKRLWRIAKFVGLGLLGIYGIVLIWLAVANAAANSKLEKKLAELREAGQPTSLADLARKPIPPEQNAATYLRRAAGDLEAIETEVEAALDKTTHEEQEAFAFRYRATPAVQKAIQSAFASFPGAVPLLKKAAACPDDDPQLDYSKAPRKFLEEDSSQDVRSPIRVLNYRVAMLERDGRREEAFETCLTMFRLVRHFERRPLLMNFLVSLAVRGVAVHATDHVLRSGPLPKTAHDALEAELALHDVPRAYQQALPTERAFEIDSFKELPAGYVMLPRWKEDLVSYMELLSAMIEVAPRPYWDADARARIETTIENSGAMTKLMIPALDAASVAVAREEAQTRSLRVLCAILAREQAGKSGEPKLADLGLPAEVTTDPFTGNPLVLKKTADGWLIYSVGLDQTDDGGQVEDRLTDVGLAPAPSLAGETRSDSKNESPASS